MDISQRIKELRITRNFTQKALAEKTKIAIGTLQQYESGKRNPTAEIIIRLAKALNVSSDQLLNVTAPIKMSSAEFSHLTEKHLNNEETEFLEQFRKLSEESKYKLFKYIELLQLSEEFYKIKNKDYEPEYRKANS